MKTFFWDKIKDTDFPKSIWKECGDKDIKFDANNLKNVEELFAQKKIEVK